MILNADDRPYRDGAAAASDEAGRGVDHGAGYKAGRFHGQAKTQRPVWFRNPKSGEFREQWGVWIEVMPI
jgi:hypothetical protein